MLELNFATLHVLTVWEPVLLLMMGVQLAGMSNQTKLTFTFSVL